MLILHGVLVRGLFNNYLTLSCLYAQFRWLISHVQIRFQPLFVNVLHRLTDAELLLSHKFFGTGGATLFGLSLLSDTPCYVEFSYYVCLQVKPTQELILIIINIFGH